MAKEAFDLIRESEDKANVILNEAKEKVKEIEYKTLDTIEEIVQKNHAELASLRQSFDSNQKEIRIEKEKELAENAEKTKVELTGKLASRKEELSKYIIEVVKSTYGSR